MDNQSKNPSPGDDLLASGSSANDPGGNEELLLLQMIEENNQPLSPTLRNIIDGSTNFEWPSAQREVSPLLMVRPQSSGIDMTAFSFMKPAQQGKSFSLHPSATRSSSAVAPPESSSRGDSISLNSNNQNGQANKMPSRGDNMGFGEKLNKTELPSLFDGQRQAERLPDAPRGGDNTGSVQEIALGADDSQKPPLPTATLSDSTESLSPSCEEQAPLTKDVCSGDTYDRGCSENRRSKTRNLTSPMNCGRRLEGEYTPQSPKQIHDTLLDPGVWKDPSKSMRPQHAEKKRVKRRLSSTLQEDSGTQLSEEALFEQLINRIKFREQSEAAASHLKKEMEANLSNLTEENAGLKAEVAALICKLQRKESETSKYKCQIEAWKLKLGRVKMFLNEIGADYQNLRGEAIHLKATRRSLEKEGKEITVSIGEVKEKVSELFKFYGERCGRVSESEHQIACLQQDLNHAKERASYMHVQLLEEKKRSTLLESYIQTYSRSQDIKLGRIRFDQVKMIKQLEVAFQELRNHLKSCNASTSSTFDSKVEEYLTLFRSLGENFSNGRVEMQQFHETLHDTRTRMDSMISQYTQDVEQNLNRTAAMTHNLEEQVQLVERNVGEDSTLLKQLCVIQQQCGFLQTQLETSVSGFEKLDSSIGAIGDSEADLTQQMINLSTNISELRLPERFQEAHVHISEKIDLEHQARELSSKLKAAEDDLKTQKLDNKEMQISLLEMRTKEQEARFQARRFETETASLQETIKRIEHDSQKELARAISDSRSHCKEEFDQQVRDVLNGKAEAEKTSEKIRGQLIEVQHVLAEMESTASKERAKFESLVKDKDKQNKEHEIDCAEKTSRLAKQDGEVEKLKQLEKMHRAQLASLQSQVDEANNKPNVFEINSSNVITANKQWVQNLQDSLTSTQKDLSKKKEEYVTAQSELEAAKSTLSTLEAEKLKTESEIEVLVQKVQDCEPWMIGAKDILHRMGILVLQESPSKALVKLEMILQSATLCNQLEGLEESTTQPHCGTPEQVRSQTEESTSRTQSINDGSPFPPNRGVTKDGFGMSPEEGLIKSPTTKRSSDIVPFSSVCRELSPSLRQIVEKEDLDISILLLTPGEAQPSNERSKSKNTDEDITTPTNPLGITNDGRSTPEIGNASAEAVINGPHITGDCTRRASIRGETTTSKSNEAEKHKEVSFETRDPTVLKIGRSRILNPDSNIEQVTASVKSLGEDRPVRNNRWTYSKRQLDSSSRTPGRLSSQNEFSSRNEHEFHGGENSTNNNKKAKLSVETSCKTSPAKLASGSSRKSSSIRTPPNPIYPTKTRALRRRTRGDKYNARFSQGGPSE